MNREKRSLLVVVCIVMTVLFAIGVTEVKAAETDTAWNYKNEIKETVGAFTYHAYTSLDGTEAWIHKIEVNRKKKYSSLNIPETLEGKSVTRIGYTDEPHGVLEEDDEMFYDGKNLFDKLVSVYYDNDGSDGLPKIKEITIPDSVNTIQPLTFAGVDYITTIKIPKKVTVLEDKTFYSCDRLKTIHLPKGLKDLNGGAFDECKKLKDLKLSSKNKNYKIKSGCVISKKEQALIYALPQKVTLKIPNGTKILKMGALDNCTPSKVHIPASVTKIEQYAFSGESYRIKDVTISKKNKKYAKDGQCIYNKKDKSLCIAIPDDRGVLYISEKIKKLTDDYVVVNCNTWEKPLKKVVFPKSLKYVKVPAFSKLSEAEKVYFMWEDPFKVTIKGYAPEVWTTLPTYTKVYVPKNSYKLYKKWYKKYDCWDKKQTKLYKFNP